MLNWCNFHMIRHLRGINTSIPQILILIRIIKFLNAKMFLQIRLDFEINIYIILRFLLDLPKLIKLFPKRVLTFKKNVKTLPLKIFFHSQHRLLLVILYLATLFIKNLQRFTFFALVNLLMALHKPL